METCGVAGRARLCEQSLDAAPHLARGFVGERDGQNGPGRDSVLVDQVGDAVRDDARFAAAGAGEDQQQALDMSGRFVLLGIQALKKVHQENAGETLVSLACGITMKPTLIAAPSRVEAAGNKPKLIDEYVGRVNSQTQAASVAHMRSPGGWQEPGQTPDFDEFTVVLRGLIRVDFEGGSMDVREGQAVIAHKGEWVRYSTPEEGGAEYIAVCLPAFSLDTVHRDSQ